MESGTLPKDANKKRSWDDILDRQIRVEQAVAACKEGKMTQSSAATHYEVFFIIYLHIEINISNLIVH
jgi:hypothetical protein